MAKPYNKTIQKLLSIIIQTAHPDKVILFGSHARGDARKDSDYDFMIIKRHIKNEREVTTSIYREFYYNKIEVPVDLIAVSTEKWQKHKDNINMVYSWASREGLVLYG